MITGMGSMFRVSLQWVVWVPKNIYCRCMLWGCLLKGTKKNLHCHSAFYDTGNYYSRNVEWGAGVDVPFKISFVVVA
jgi:hypothetical protein